MTKDDAIKRLKKLYGSKLLWEENTTAPRDSSIRDAAKAAYPVLKQRAEELQAQRDARAKDLLEGDVEYQRLKAETQSARAEKEKVSWKTDQYRIKVGRNLGFAFKVDTSGDNWADVVAKAEAKQSKGVL